MRFFPPFDEGRRRGAPSQSHRHRLAGSGTRALLLLVALSGQGCGRIGYDLLPSDGPGIAGAGGRGAGSGGFTNGSAAGGGRDAGSRSVDGGGASDASPPRPDGSAGSPSGSGGTAVEASISGNGGTAEASTSGTGGNATDASTSGSGGSAVDSGSGGTVNTPPIARLLVTPGIGDPSTVFTADAAGTTDREDPPSALTYAWDW